MSQLDSRIDEVRARNAELTQLLSDPAVLADQGKRVTLGREQSRLSEIVQLADRIDRIRAALADARELSRESDPEMAAMAKAELDELNTELPPLEEKLVDLLSPRDPLDDRAAVVEIRAGSGGDEAALFAGELNRMYVRYATRHKWTVESVSLSGGTAGGVKEAVFVVRGPDAYGTLRLESGVHRVQRVPATETQGRIHTSAATVAVLPEAEEIDIQIEPNDIRVDVFRSQGPGGQSVNTTDSAVRITHIPTGLVVSCQDEKSQIKNKARAMAVLRSRLLDLKVAQQEAERARDRKLQVGTGDRSAKIRTYNFPQSRVTDHRIGFTTHALPQVMDGELDELIAAVRLAWKRERESTG